MYEHIKKFWKVLLGSFLLGIVLAILWDIPWQFFVTIAVFVFILNTIVEEAKSIGGAAFDAMKKFFLIGVGVTAFVGVRAVVGYLLDMPAGQSYNDAVVSSGGLSGIATQRLTANIVFELLFLLPGYGIARMLVGSGGKFSKSVLAIVGLVLLSWVVWTIKQPPHTEATRRQVQAMVSLDARSRTHDALAKTAAAISSYGVAKEAIAVFYQLNGGTNMVKDSSLTNRVLAVGEQVIRPNPEEPPFFYQGMTFVQVVLKNPDGSFLGGYSTWVEVRQFNWVDGGRVSLEPMSRGGITSYLVNQDEVISTLSVPDNSTVYMEADKTFAIFEDYRDPDGSTKTIKTPFPVGRSKKYFTWGGTLKVVGLHTNTIIKLHL